MGNPGTVYSIQARNKYAVPRITWRLQKDEEKRRFRVREWWDRSRHGEPLNRTRRSVWE
jgi:hypothetical protein